jgi:hypothetical protein
MYVPNKESQGMTTNMRETYERMAREAAEKLAALDRVPDLASMEPGTVLFYRINYVASARDYPGGTYSYAAILVKKPSGGRYWYTTGLRETSFTDEELTQILAAPNVLEISIVTEWQVLAGEAEETLDS